jgi:hypothetical protein
MMRVTKVTTTKATTSITSHATIVVLNIANPFQISAITGIEFLEPFKFHSSLNTCDTSVLFHGVRSGGTTKRKTNA